MKNILKRIFYRRINYKELCNNNKSLCLWSAGLQFKDRWKNIQKCHLHEIVYLIREPNNENDTNAIHIKRRNNQSLGYIDRKRAIILAPMIDNGLLDNRATIVGLKCDPKKNIFGVRISLPLDEDTFEKLEDPNQEIEFFFNVNEKNNKYLFLNCSENTLDQIQKTIESANINIERIGVSFSPSSDGKLYSWYIKLGEHVDKRIIENLLENNFNIHKDKEINQEYIELQDEEISELKNRINKLSAEVQKSESTLEKYTRINKTRNEEFDKLIRLTNPKVIFIRDSIEILLNEVKDYSDPIKKVIEYKQDHQKKGKKINTLSNWFEIHYNTGQKDTGRIYFKRDTENFYVLISFKNTQNKDIRFLQKLDLP